MWLEKILKGENYLIKEGTYWLVTSHEHVVGATRTWTNVTCRWAGIGPMPNWSKEEHRFIINIQEKQNDQAVCP